MQLNQATDYAFRVVLHFSKLAADTVVRGQTLAEKENIPARFLLKIMRSLTQGGIIRSYRGVVGGYALAKLPADISLYDVIEALEGPINIHRCLAGPERCNRLNGGQCRVHYALAGVQNSLVEDLRKISFEMLAREE
ncbi:MAG: Rrf2 family transcriptional regulator [Sporomusaceae bacterium]|nr:Rrf2 family transcriptional regulator [Sporomusaceae bacterium]